MCVLLQARREKYVKQMKKLVDVDVYGKAKGVARSELRPCILSTKVFRAANSIDIHSCSNCVQFYHPEPGFLTLIVNHCCIRTAPS